MIRIITSYLIIIITFCCSCNEDPDPGLVGPTASEIKKTNAVRKQLGLREINDTWKFYYRKRKFPVDIWKEGAYECKTIVYWDDTYENIRWEDDYYYTGKTFLIDPALPEEGTTWEMFTIHYDYDDGVFRINYVGINSEILITLEKLNLSTVGYHSESNTETLKIADQILDLLGFSRL